VINNSAVNANLVTSGPVAADVLAAATGIYARAFAAAPYFEPPARASEFADQIRRYERDREGARFAWAAVGDVQVVMASGVIGVAGTWWRDRVLGLIGDRDWLGESCLEIVHVAVDPSHQRRGAGRLVLDLIQSGAPARTAVLGCDPSVQGFYLAAGFTEIGSDPTSGQRFMGRRLRF
jgi:GNAT superfamily N-acetyltransferase